MRRMYERPEMRGQAFAANEYVASCKDEPVSYLFKCDKPSEYHGWGLMGYYSSLYYYDSQGRAHELGGYYPCDETHIAPTTDSFYKGFVDNNENGREDQGEDCYVWLEYDRWGRIDDWHATTQGTPNSWEKNVS